MLETWQLLIASSVLIESIAHIYRRYFLEKYKLDTVLFAILYQIIGGIGIFLYLIVAEPQSIQLDINENWPNLLLSIFLYFIGSITITLAYKKSQASEVVIIFATRAIWIIVGASIFLDEVITTGNIIGAILIILSIVLLTYSPKKSKKFKPNKGVVYALISAPIFGLALVNDAYVTRSMETEFYVFISFFIVGIIMLPLRLNKLGQVKENFNFKFAFNLFMASVPYTASVILALKAIEAGNNAAQIGPIQQTTVIITTLLGIIFLKENSQYIKKIISACIAFLGAYLVNK